MLLSEGNCTLLPFSILSSNGSHEFFVRHNLEEQNSRGTADLFCIGSQVNGMNSRTKQARLANHLHADANAAGPSNLCTHDERCTYFFDYGYISHRTQLHIQLQLAPRTSMASIGCVVGSKGKYRPSTVQYNKMLYFIFQQCPHSTFLRII